MAAALATNSSTPVKAIVYGAEVSVDVPVDIIVDFGDGSEPRVQTITLQ